MLLDIIFIWGLCYCAAKLATLAEKHVQPSEEEIRRRVVENLWRSW